MSVWYAFRSPGFVAGITAIATAAVWKAIQPAITRPETAEARVVRIDDYRRGRGDNDMRRRSGSPRARD